MRTLSTLFVLSSLCAPAFAQSPAPQTELPAATLTVRSNLVLVPALVKTKKGELVLSLTADDFVLTDDGVPQPLRLDPDTDFQPLAMVMVVEAGGSGKLHLGEYRSLDSVLETTLGGVQHRVAVVSFDSGVQLDQTFTTDTTKAIQKLNTVEPGDDGAAILDAVIYATDLLRKQPASYRRAIVLLSETIDNASEASFDEALRAVDDTNTSIYSFGFSSTKAALKHEASKLPHPWQRTKYSSEPYPPGGCMAKNADPDAHGNRAVQVLDCLSDLAPPLRLARMAFITATDNMKRNVPESVAGLTGGEYFSFKDARTLNRGLSTITNDVTNHYVLSFHPQSPHTGLHALNLMLKDHPDLDLKARSAYWIDDPGAVKPSASQ